MLYKGTNSSPRYGVLNIDRRDQLFGALKIRYKVRQGPSQRSTVGLFSVLKIEGTPGTRSHQQLFSVLKIEGPPGVVRYSKNRRRSQVRFLGGHLITVCMAAACMAGSAVTQVWQVAACMVGSWAQVRVTVPGRVTGKGWTVRVRVPDSVPC